jgi:hypothetical protein
MGPRDAGDGDDDDDDDNDDDERDAARYRSAVVTSPSSPSAESDARADR